MKKTVMVKDTVEGLAECIDEVVSTYASGTILDVSQLINKGLKVDVKGRMATNLLIPIA